MSPKIAACGIALAAMTAIAPATAQDRPVMPGVSGGFSSGGPGASGPRGVAPPPSNWPPEQKVPPGYHRPPPKVENPPHPPRYPRYRDPWHWNDPGYYRPAPRYSYGVSCEDAVRIMRRHGFRSIKVYDCEGRYYSFRAYRHGKRYVVTVRARDGEIVELERA